MAISPQHGVVQATCNHGGTTKEVFQTSFNSLQQNVAEPRAVLIMDNAPCHKDCNIPVAVKYLPAYSPFLNPIENAFSCWKAAVKRLLAMPDVQENINDKDAAAAAGHSLLSSFILSWRREILETIGQAALSEIDAQKCLSWHQFCITYLPQCQDMANILF